MWLVVQVQVCSVPRRWLGWNQPNRQIGLVHQAQCCVELDRETIAVGFDQWSACHVSRVDCKAPTWDRTERTNNCTQTLWYGSRFAAKHQWQHEIMHGLHISNNWQRSMKQTVQKRPVVVRFQTDHYIPQKSLMQTRMEYNKCWCNYTAPTKIQMKCPSW